MFNDFLRKMKDDFLGTRYSAFWDKVAQGTTGKHALPSFGLNFLTLSSCLQIRPFRDCCVDG